MWNSAHHEGNGAKNNEQEKVKRRGEPFFMGCSLSNSVSFLSLFECLEQAIKQCTL